MIPASNFFKIPNSFVFRDFFLPQNNPWQWIPNIKEALLSYDFKQGSLPNNIPKNCEVHGPVYCHPSVQIMGHCYIEGPVYIGANTQIRPGAFIRGNVIVGEKCVLGNSSEYKNCLLLNEVETPHFNYIGDSILGNKVHLGAGAILANLRLDRQNITLKLPNGNIETGLRKMGAIIGDHTEIGCHSVLQPGTVIGAYSTIMSAVTFRGYLPERHVVKCDSLTKPIIIAK